VDVTENTEFCKLTARCNRCRCRGQLKVDDTAFRCGIPKQENRSLRRESLRKRVSASNPTAYFGFSVQTIAETAK